MQIKLITTWLWHPKTVEGNELVPSILNTLSDGKISGDAHFDKRN
jgi:hypothetical protein